MTTYDCCNPLPIKDPALSCLPSSKLRFSTFGPEDFFWPSSLHMPINRAQIIPYTTLARAASMRPCFCCPILCPTTPPLAILRQSAVTTSNCKSPVRASSRTSCDRPLQPGFDPGIGGGCVPNYGSRIHYQALSNYKRVDQYLPDTGGAEPTLYAGVCGICMRIRSD